MPPPRIQARNFYQIRPIIVIIFPYISFLPPRRCTMVRKRALHHTDNSFVLVCIFFQPSICVPTYLPTYLYIVRHRLVYSMNNGRSVDLMGYFTWNACPPWSGYHRKCRREGGGKEKYIKQQLLRCIRFVISHKCNFHLKRCPST